MKLGKRIALGAACALLLALSWVCALSMETDSQRQARLLAQSEAYLEDEIYILTVPLLEEAAACGGDYTAQAEEQLKEVYQQLFDQSGYRRKYTALLETQMGREDAPPEVFREAAEYYFGTGDYEEALAVLRSGIQRTGDQELNRLYEDRRYEYTFGRAAYENVTAICNGGIQVEENGKWGLAKGDGTLVIPCEYDWISTYSQGRVVVIRDGVISAIDTAGNRVALLHEEADACTNLADDRLAVRTDQGWKRANSSLKTAAPLFEEIGMYQDGHAAARQDGKWGVIDESGAWVIQPQYDDVLRDELGRCWSQGAVFVRQGQEVLLLVDGEETAGGFEDARPFADGYAAVKRDGLWGFLDRTGQVVLDFQYEDALSFGQHLAAVRTGSFWGYISRTGELVIPAQFLAARSFSGGSAPVQTAEGWQFITLREE